MGGAEQTQVVLSRVLSQGRPPRPLGEMQWGGLLALGLPGLRGGCPGPGAECSAATSSPGGPRSPLPPAGAKQTKSCSKGLSWKAGTTWDFFFPCFKVLKPVITLDRLLRLLPHSPACSTPWPPRRAQMRMIPGSAQVLPPVPPPRGCLGLGGQQSPLGSSGAAGDRRQNVTCKVMPGLGLAAESVFRSSGLVCTL